MKLVLRIGDHSGNDSVTHATATRFPVTLGRGFDCDVILPDPHASARHADIAHDGEGWVLRDLGSENGTLLHGAPLSGGQARLRSGDEIMIGRTPVTVFDPHHPVPPAARLEHAHPFIAHISQGVAPWLSLALAVAAVCLADYLSLWTDNTAAQVAKTGGAIVFLILLWALPWSVAGRLIRHRSGFRAHIALVSLCLLAATLLGPLKDMLYFLTGEGLLSLAVEHLVNALLLALLVYGSLAIATHMTVRRRMAATAFFIAGLLGILAALSYIERGHFSPQPEYAILLQPYGYGLPPTQDIDTFMTGNQALLDSRRLSPGK